ncbi:MAG TPA: prepilin-type N-terminal cleavage/methylation domain-containing protein [Longimicrobiales bacterium]|nr:prepilin-type N-terminal cleavage/methylation domain-containing protein [Longimicrobiales bacterium]
MTVNNQKGFTLIELLIVVVIIGILAAIAIPKFSATREKAYVAAMKSDLRNLATAEDLYYSSDNDAIPGTDYAYADPTTALGGTNAALEFTPSEGVSIAGTVSLDAQGWAAVASHQAITAQCSVYHGNGTPTATAGGLTPNAPGVIACDNL